MKVWNAFSSTDIDNENFLSVVELKILLWVYEDDEPNEYRVKRELSEIDSNNTEIITRQKWMNYFCSLDAHNEKVFRANLKKTFKKYDTDNSGTLSKSEIRNLIKDIFKLQLNLVDNVANRVKLY